MYYDPRAVWVSISVSVIILSALIILIGTLLEKRKTRAIKAFAHNNGFTCELKKADSLEPVLGFSYDGTYAPTIKSYHLSGRLPVSKNSFVIYSSPIHVYISETAFVQSIYAAFKRTLIRVKLSYAVPTFILVSKQNRRHTAGLSLRVFKKSEKVLLSHTFNLNFELYAASSERDKVEHIFTQEVQDALLKHLSGSDIVSTTEGLAAIQYGKFKVLVAGESLEGLDIVAKHLASSVHSIKTAPIRVLPKKRSSAFNYIFRQGAARFMFWSFYFTMLALSFWAMLDSPSESIVALRQVFVAMSLPIDIEIIQRIYYRLILPFLIR